MISRMCNSGRFSFANDTNSLYTKLLWDLRVELYFSNFKSFNQNNVKWADQIRDNNKNMIFGIRRCFLVWKLYVNDKVLSQLYGHLNLFLGFHFTMETLTDDFCIAWFENCAFLQNENTSRLKCIPGKLSMFITFNFYLRFHNLKHFCSKLLPSFLVLSSHIRS